MAKKKAEKKCSDCGKDMSKCKCEEGSKKGKGKFPFPPKKK